MTPFTCNVCTKRAFLFGDYMNKKFDDITERIAPVLKRITHRLNGHFTFFSDDDLFQEALIHLWILFKQDKLGDKTDSYIVQGCYFHLKNYIRTKMDKAKLISMSTIIDEEDSSIEELLSVQDLHQFDKFEEELFFKRLSLNGLTPREMRILRLLMDGLTVREIGKKLGVSHVMVVKLKNRIKNKCLDSWEDLNQGYQN